MDLTSTDLFPALENIPVNDLSRDPSALQTATAAALARVAASGWYLLGPELGAFEQAFGGYLGVQHCVGVANGTDAIELALRGVGCAPGDEVLTAANAGSYATTAMLRAGLVPRYCDVDPTTLCLSSATVSAGLTPRTRAVVVTHLYGMMADIEAIVGLCRTMGIAVVEDCAQAAGASRAGAFAGAIGDAGSFSFYPTKNLGAMGDAGAVVTNDSEVASRVRCLSQYGWESKYRAVLRGGMNSRMDEVQAAVLCARLPLLDQWNACRREIVGRYADALEPANGRLVFGRGEDFVGHLAVVVTSRRRELRDLFERAAIGTDVHYPVADHRQAFWAGAHNDVNLPVTESLLGQVLTVPCFAGLTDAEVERVCEVLREF